MSMRETTLAVSLLFAVLVAAPTVSRAADPFPRACVSCHVVDEAKSADHRLSTAMAQWTAGKVAPGLLAKSKASAPAGVTLKGKHPAAEDALDDIPGACLDCHDSGSKKAPPFSRLLHLVHLEGGAENVYVTAFKSECRNCHKLNPQTGEWSVPSGPEQ